MKTLLSILTFSILFVTSTDSIAHGNHGNININSSQAKSIAIKISKRLSFKDIGYSVGKLDKSWRQQGAEQATTLASENGNQRVLLENKTNGEAIIVTISSSGEVLTVKKNHKIKDKN